jgi:CHASE3 domain sensor protein
MLPSFSPILDWWKRVPLRRKGLVSIVLPVTAVLVSSVFAFFGNQSRQHIQWDIQRKFAFINTFNEILALMVNAETGMRGFQLTRKEGFLQPYEIAKQTLPEKIEILQTLINEEPGEEPRARKSQVFDRLKELISLQMSDLEWQERYTSKTGELDDQLDQHLNQGKAYMDEIRSLLSQMQSYEANRLSERIEEIDAIRVRDYILIFVILFVALITRFVSWYLFKIGIHQRVGRMIKKLKSLRQEDDVEIDVAGEMETLEAEFDYRIERMKENDRSMDER